MGKASGTKIGLIPASRIARVCRGVGTGRFPARGWQIGSLRVNRQLEVSGPDELSDEAYFVDGASEV